MSDATAELIYPVGTEAIYAYEHHEDQSLGKVVLPEGLTTIYPRAFMDSSLSEIFLPFSLTHIESEAFCDCKLLEVVHLPPGLVKLGSYAFAGCEQLRLVTMGELVGFACHLYDREDERHGQFVGCSSLLAVSMPDAVAARAYIGDEFGERGCPPLRQLRDAAPAKLQLDRYFWRPQHHRRCLPSLRHTVCTVMHVAARLRSQAPTSGIRTKLRFQAAVAAAASGRPWIDVDLPGEIWMYILKMLTHTDLNGCTPSETWSFSGNPPMTMQLQTLTCGDDGQVECHPQ